MILLQEASPKAPKHPHYSQLIFTVCIACTWIIYYIFDSPFSTYPSSSLIAAPEVAVHDYGCDSLPVLQVMVSYEPWHCLCDCFFYQRAKGKVLAVCTFAFLEDGQETMVGVEVRPAFGVVIWLFRVAAAS